MCFALSASLLTWAFYFPQFSVPECCLCFSSPQLGPEVLHFEMSPLLNVGWLSEFHTGTIPSLVVTLVLNGVFISDEKELKPYYPPPPPFDSLPWNF